MIRSTDKGKNCFLLTLLLFVVTASYSSAGRFVSVGPIITVTLKDPKEQNQSSSSLSSSDEQELQKPWFNIGNFRPNIIWSLQSKGKPLPNWISNLHSLRTTIGYQYSESQKYKHMPTFIEADLKFSTEQTGIDLQIQPTYDIESKRSIITVQASRGPAVTLMAKFSTKKDRWLQTVKGCYQATLPYASVSAIRVTPSVDLNRGHASCLLEAVTGSQCTKAVLNLEYDNPTLTVIHSLNERNTIAPEISLYDARIIYQWNIALDSGSIRTRVDPTSDVSVTWTDRSMNGKWVTDVRLPLSGTTLSALAADVKVRRQFNF